MRLLLALGRIGNASVRFDGDKLAGRFRRMACVRERRPAVPLAYHLRSHVGPRVAMSAGTASAVLARAQMRMPRRRSNVGRSS
jgi:hypothetical protein